MKHITENNQYEKSISYEMLNFCPLCMAEVYALRCDAMRAGTSHYPLHPPTTTYCFKTRNRIAIRVVIPSTNSPMPLQGYAVFLNLQNSHKTAGTLWVFHL